MEEFARNEYRSYMLIDFSKVSKEVKEIFDRMLLRVFCSFLKTAFVRAYGQKTSVMTDYIAGLSRKSI